MTRRILPAKRRARRAVRTMVVQPEAMGARLEESRRSPEASLAQLARPPEKGPKDFWPWRHAANGPPWTSCSNLWRRRCKVRGRMASSCRSPVFWTRSVHMIAEKKVFSTKTKLMYLNKKSNRKNVKFLCGQNRFFARFILRKF